MSAGRLAAAAKIELLARTLERRVSILPAVAEIRQSGLVAAVRLSSGANGRQMAALAAQAARRRGAAVGVRGNAVVLHVSRSDSEADIRRLVAVLASSIAEVAVGRLPAAA